MLCTYSHCNTNILSCIYCVNHWYVSTKFPFSLPVCACMSQGHMWAWRESWQPIESASLLINALIGRPSTRRQQLSPPPPLPVLLNGNRTPTSPCTIKRYEIDIYSRSWGPSRNIEMCLILRPYYLMESPPAVFQFRRIEDCYESTTEPVP